MSDEQTNLTANEKRAIEALKRELMAARKQKVTGTLTISISVHAGGVTSVYVGKSFLERL